MFNTRTKRRGERAGTHPVIRRKALTLAIFQGLFASAHAATIIVDSNEDTAATDGACTLREAMVNANDDAQTHVDCAAGDGNTDVVRIPAPHNTVITLESALPTIVDGMTIEANGTTVRRQGGCIFNDVQDEGEFRLLEANSAGSVTIQRMNLEGGCADGGTATARTGGAILLQGTGLQLQLTNSTISSNSAAGDGGGIGSSDGTSASVTLTSVTLADNTAGARGGAMNAVAGVVGSADGLTVADNSAGQLGGGFYLYSGALTVWQLNEASFSTNTAGGSSGGAIFANEAYLFFNDSVISGNSAGLDGGGIRSAGLFLTDSALHDNVGGAKGGGALVTRSASIQNSTVSGNTGGVIGGLYVTANGTLSAGYSTFAYNLDGGSRDVQLGLQGPANIFVQGSIIASTGTAACSLDSSGGAINYISVPGAGSNIASDTSCDPIAGSSASLASIALKSLGDNGGPTPTHALGAGSVAIDAGESSCGQFDQRGRSRFADGDKDDTAICDKGAFEFIPSWFVNSADDVGDGTCDATCTFRDALADATGTSDIVVDAGLSASTVTLSSALPPSSGGTIQGNGLTIERDPSLVCNRDGNQDAGEFRLLQASGYLVASSLNLVNGCAEGTAGFGGGITSLFDLTLNHVTISGSWASAAGGAIRSSQSITLTDSTLDGNTAGSVGGAVYAHNGAALMVDRSTISNNYAGTYGGGIYSANSDLTITTSTVSGNTAEYSGSGLMALAATSTVQIADSTVAYNGPLPINAINSDVALTRSIVAGSGTQCSGVSGTFTFSDNFATDTSCGEATTATLQQLDLQTLADNGGPTLTHALGAGSVAIDTGNTDCTGPDQRGFTRPVESCDFGAFEVQEDAQAGPDFVVNAADDNGDGVCGTKIGECTLRDAVLAANSNVDASVITFGSPLNESSTATLTQGPLTTLHEVEINAAYATIARDTSAGNCVMDGAQEAHEFRLFLNDGNLIISSATLMGGCADGATSVDQVGGGVYSRAGSSLSLDNATLTGNSAGAGGAVGSNAAQISANSTTFSLNTATVFGGAIYGVFDSGVSLNGTTVERNDAGLDGGGIFISGNTLSISGGTLGANTATRDGGGIAGNGTAITIDNGYIFNNSAGADGGLIHNKSGGSISLTSSYVTSHFAYGNGGAIATGKGTVVTIENSTIRDASAGADGGALYLRGEFTARSNLSLTRSSLFGNQATGAGGAVFAYYIDLTLDNATISSNTAAIGGGIDGNSSSTVTLLHATLANNFATTGGQQVDGSETSFAVTRSLFVGDNGTNCALSGGPSLTSADSLSTDNTCGPLVTGVVTPGDLNLGDLASNGGATRTHLPGPFSVAVDAAAGCSGTDQRGVARPQDADGVGTDNCDVGAVEVQNTPVMAVDDSATTDQDTTATGSVTDNEIDAADEDGGVFTVVAVDGVAGNVGMDVTAGSSSLIINADGSFNFDPSFEFDGLDDGQQDSIAVDYTVSDGFASDTATLTITINGLNDAPIAEATSATTTEDATVIQSFNATDVDGEALSFTIDSQPGGGTVVNNGDGTFTFDPDGAFEHLDDLDSEDVTFTYTASDTDLSASATVTVTVTGVNDAPVATDDANTAVAGEILSVDAANGLLANDTDVENDPLTVITTGMFTPTGGGSLTVNADGSFSFDPTGASSDTVTFDYTVSDGDLEDTARLTIAISQDNEVNLSIAKSDGQDIVSPGDVLTYTITVLNEGPADVAGARVEDIIPAELLDAGWSCAPVGAAACNTSGDGDIDELVNIPAGDAVEFTLSAQVDPAVSSATVSNTATVTAPTGLTETDPSDNSATDVTGTDLVFADGFEGMPMAKAFSPRTATVDAKALAALPDGGRPVLVLRGIDRGSDDLAMALIHARRIGDLVQLRISRLEAGQWVIGEWTQMRGDAAELRW